MAPVRRYLRISKYSVLECRIYLDNPALAQSWLLNPRNPILPRVIESIRPLVLPKLREEKERSKKKSTKKKSIKDVVVTAEFEVSVFLTETNTRHSLLTKTKHFREKLPARMESNSNKLIDETNETVVDVDALDQVPILQEENDYDSDVGLANIPLHRRSKRHRDSAGEIAGPGTPDGDDDDDDAESAIFVDSDTEAPPPKRQKGQGGPDDPDEDDKKKLAMDVSYDGFAIYGRVLCLVVKKRDANRSSQLGNRAGTAGSRANNGSRPEGQAKMENWISSTQLHVGEDVP